MAPRKPSTTPKSAMQNLFPDIPYEGNPDNNTKPSEDQNDKISALLGRIDELSRSVGSLQEANAALMAQPQVIYAPPVIAQPQGEPQMPDPLEDPQGYTNFLTERILNRVDHIMSQNAQAQDREVQMQNTSDALWNDFSGQYEHWSDHPDEIGYIAQKVVDNAKKKGLDTEKYVLQNRNQYFKDIDAEARKMFGHLLPDEGNGEGTPYDDNVDRSGGIFTGQGAPMPRGVQKPAGAGDMIQDILKMQKESGFH